MRIYILITDNMLKHTNTMSQRTSVVMSAQVYKAVKDFAC